MHQMGGTGSTFSASFFDNLRWIVCVRQAGAEINLQMCVVREHNSMMFVKNNGPGTTLVGQFCSDFPTVWSLRMGSSGLRDHKHVKIGEIQLYGFFRFGCYPPTPCAPFGGKYETFNWGIVSSPFLDRIFVIEELTVFTLSMFLAKSF